MKNIVFLFALALANTTLNAQSPQYTAAMTKTLSALDSAQTPADFLAVANTFSRIAAAEPAEWLPSYYGAFSHLIAGFILFGSDAPKAVQAIDQAQAGLDKAKALAPQESELAVLQAYILIGRVTENPMVKGAELSPRVFGELGKAAALNPDNPRASFLYGMYTLNMPEFYGGGAANAKPHFEKAAALFAKEHDRGLLPAWGRDDNAKQLARVSK